MKTVLITGASSGIGAASARVFAAKGANVILVARRADRLSALAGEIGDNAHAIPCDAGDTAAVEAMAERVLAEHGVPDVIVNCAGGGRWLRTEDTPPEEAISMMAAPYFAAFFVTRAFLPGMLERDRGVIIHVNSPAGRVTWPNSAGYAAARGALTHFNEALAHDLAGTRIRTCNAIFGRVSSEYFDVNEGAADHMPWLATLMPELTPEYCARKIVALARQPRTEPSYPAVLPVLLFFARHFPGITRRLVRL